MKVNWNGFRAAIAGLLIAGGIGCGGLNASHSVSPASFFLPGLGHATPPASAQTNAPSQTWAAFQSVQ